MNSTELLIVIRRITLRSWEAFDLEWDGGTEHARRIRTKAPMPALG